MNTNDHKPMTGIISAVALSLVIFFAIGLLSSRSNRLPIYIGKDNIKPEPITGTIGCMLSKHATHFEETITIDDKTWTAMTAENHQHIGFLVRAGKAEWKTRPMLVCDGKEAYFWYWRKI